MYIAVGAFCFGVAVGWLTGTVFARIPTPGLASLSGVITAMIGTAFAGVIRAMYQHSTVPPEVWLYFVGLLLALALSLLMVWLHERRARRVGMIANDAAAARSVIEDFLKRRRWVSISFERARTKFNPSWKDGFLDLVIRSYPETFRPITIKGGKRGLGLK